MDGSRKKLTIPKSFIPYLEKHRIAELYREIARELIIQQPVDHLLFIKQILENAANTRDVPRAIMLATPNVNCLEVAKIISKDMGLQMITFEDVLALTKRNDSTEIDAALLASALRHLTRQNNAYKTGWIIVGCIRTAKDAQALIAAGIVPTHVLHLIPPFLPKLTELLYCNVSESWPEYRRAICVIRDIFKNKLVEVFLGDDMFHTVVEKCIAILKTRDKLSMPLKPRVLILGPKGSGRKTQAKLLQTMHNLVFIDFELLLCQLWKTKTDLGRRLRECREKVCYRSDLLAECVNWRILQYDCMECGWVMTGFPFTVADFRHLDLLDTPPNRVILLECDLNVCKERAVNRRIDVYTGEVVDIADKPTMAWNQDLKIHPKDRAGYLTAELQFYCENYGPIRSYCKDSSVLINGDQPKRWVYESIIAYIYSAPPAGKPRVPCEAVIEEISDVVSVTTSSESTQNSSSRSTKTNIQCLAKDFEYKTNLK